MASFKISVKLVWFPAAFAAEPAVPTCTGYYIGNRLYLHLKHLDIILKTYFPISKAFIAMLLMAFKAVTFAS